MIQTCFHRFNKFNVVWKSSCSFLQNLHFPNLCNSHNELKKKWPTRAGISPLSCVHFQRHTFECLFVVDAAAPPSSHPQTVFSFFFSAPGQSSVMQPCSPLYLPPAVRVERQHEEVLHLPIEAAVGRWRVGGAGSDQPVHDVVVLEASTPG